jgi:hypothetical protein
VVPEFEIPEFELPEIGFGMIVTPPLLPSTEWANESASLVSCAVFSEIESVVYRVFVAHQALAMA